MDANSYISQRLAAVGGDSEIETLKAENERLKQQLEQMPAANFKSEAQAAFEQSGEFDNILNAFYLRFMRDKFSMEFRNSPYIQDFQSIANKAFAEFEKNYKQKEGPKNAHSGKKDNGGASKTDARQDA